MRRESINPEKVVMESRISTGSGKETWDMWTLGKTADTKIDLVIARSEMIGTIRN
jgi:hypothetical protein